MGPENAFRRHKIDQHTPEGRCLHENFQNRSSDYVQDDPDDRRLGPAQGQQ